MTSYPGLQHLDAPEHGVRSCRDCNTEHKTLLHCSACVEHLSAERLLEEIREYLVTRGHNGAHAYTVDTATMRWLEAHPAYVEAL